jgi:hypothetical protein
MSRLALIPMVEDTKVVKAASKFESLRPTNPCTVVTSLKLEKTRLIVILIL